MKRKLSKQAKRGLLICGCTIGVGCGTVTADMGIEQNEYDVPIEQIKSPSVNKVHSQPPAESSSRPVSSQATSQVQQQTTVGPVEDSPLFFDTEGLSDEDGLGQLTYQWQARQANGTWTMVEEGTSQSFSPRQAQVNKPLRVRIEYLDGQGTLESIVSPATPPVKNVNDLPTGKLKLIGKSVEDQALHIDASEINDEDGMGKISYIWERSEDGVAWTSVSNDRVDASLLRLTQQHVGYLYRGKVTYTDHFGTVESVRTLPSDVVQNLDDPVLGALAIRGKLATGASLSVDTSQLLDEDGIKSISVIWQVSENGTHWESVADVKDRTLNLTKQNVGQVIRAKAIVIDNFGNQSEVFSPVSEPVENVNSRPSGIIRIIGGQ